MSFLWKYFPVLYVLPFLAATSRFEDAATVSELLRWAVLAGGCGVAAWHGFRRAHSKPGRFATGDWMMLGFICLFLASSFWSIAPSYTFQRGASILLLYGCSLWALWTWVDRFSEDRLIAQVLATLAVVMSINLVVGGLLFPAELLGSRFQGLFYNPNNIGLIVAIALPLSVGRWLRFRSPWMLLVAAVLAGNLIACGTRSAALGFVVSFVLMLLPYMIQRPIRALVIGGVVVVSLLAFAQTTFFEERILREESLETGSNRTLFWELAEDYIADRPMLGHGFATDAMIHEYNGLVLSDVALRGYGVMSSYYGLAVQLGWPLTWLYFGSLWGFVFWCLIRHRKNLAVVVPAAAIASGLIVCIFEPAIYSAGNCFSFLFWMVVMLAVRRVHYRKIGVRLRRDGGLLRRKNPRRPKRRRKRFAGREQSGVAPARSDGQGAPETGRA